MLNIGSSCGIEAGKACCKCLKGFVRGLAGIHVGMKRGVSGRYESKENQSGKLCTVFLTLSLVQENSRKQALCCRVFKEHGQCFMAAFPSGWVLLFMLYFCSCAYYGYFLVNFSY